MNDPMTKLNHFAAPFFSGMTFAAGVIAVSHSEYFAAIFMTAAAMGYWSRCVWLFAQEIRNG